VECYVKKKELKIKKQIEENVNTPEVLVSGIEGENRLTFL
jgi:hypothetical protein